MRYKKSFATRQVVTIFIILAAVALNMLTTIIHTNGPTTAATTRDSSTERSSSSSSSSNKNNKTKLLHHTTLTSMPMSQPQEVSSLPENKTNISTLLLDTDTADAPVVADTSTTTTTTTTGSSHTTGAANDDASSTTAASWAVQQKVRLWLQQSNQTSSSRSHHLGMPPHTPGAMIHVGKTGGSTLSLHLRFALSFVGAQTLSWRSEKKIIGQ